MRPEVGISFMPTHDPNKLRHNAVETGRHPFPRIAVYDDLGNPPPMVQLAEFARFTETAQVGPEGIPIAKLHPDEVVGDMTFLEGLRPGNVFLGLVPGAWMDAMGLDEASVSQMRDGVEVISYLLRKETEGHSGKKFKVKPGFKLQYPTPETIPMVIGAHGPRMLTLAGELSAVKAVKLGGTANPLRVADARDKIAVGAQRIGREASEMGIVLGAVTVVDRDGRKALEYAKRLAIPYIDVVGDLDPLVRGNPEIVALIERVKSAYKTGDVDVAVRALPDDVARLFMVAGTPDEVTEHVIEIVKAGGSFEFGTPHGIDGKTSIEAEVTAIKLLGEEVLPAVEMEINKL